MFSQIRCTFGVDAGNGIKLMPIIKIPAVVSDTGSSKTVEVEGGTVGDVIRQYSDSEDENLVENVLDNGGIREYINVYVNGKDVRDIQGIDTPVGDDDEIRIIPAASGG